MAPPRPQDLSAGFTGLVVAMVFLGAVIFGMVNFTNWWVGRHAAETPAAEASH